MGKKIKKGTRGEAVIFVTRSQALKKLQLTLREFRRLCILKGIFPKDPKKKFKGVNKTYYYLKDIKFLATEKLLSKFRQIQSYEKKIKKAKMKNERYDMNKLIENKPKYSIDHILKERYPRFIDAVNDLDDALCLITLFSKLPTHELLNIKPELVQLCQRLTKEFYLYCAISQNFKKGFITIKGIYLNIELIGNELTWLNPFSNPQKMTFEVDYEIMLNFLELYTNLMKFVNLKLFKDIGMEYLYNDKNLFETDLPYFGFTSLDIRSLQESLNSKNSTTEDLNLQSEELHKIKMLEEENKKLKTLFRNCVFFISREVPNEVFSLAILACGGIYGDESENSPFKIDDPRITHFVIDRPSEFINFEENKEYIQPQWVLDCVNRRSLLPVSEYTPGRKLPPHISPFYEYDEEGAIKLKMKKVVKTSEDIKEEIRKEENAEEKNLNEMLISNNKKKILNRIREEKLKNKKKPITVKKLSNPNNK